MTVWLSKSNTKQHTSSPLSTQLTAEQRLADGELHPCGSNEDMHYDKDTRSTRYTFVFTEAVEGVYVFEAVAIDSQGNWADSEELLVAVDTAPPMVSARLCGWHSVHCRFGGSWKHGSCSLSLPGHLDCAAPSNGRVLLPKPRDPRPANFGLAHSYRYTVMR